MAQNSSYWSQQGSQPPAGATKKHPNTVQKIVAPSSAGTYSNEQQQKT